MALELVVALPHSRVHPGAHHSLPGLLKDRDHCQRALRLYLFHGSLPIEPEVRYMEIVDILESAGLDQVGRPDDVALSGVASSDGSSHREFRPGDLVSSFRFCPCVRQGVFASRTSRAC